MSNKIKTVKKIKSIFQAVNLEIEIYERLAESPVGTKKKIY